LTIFPCVVRDGAGQIEPTPVSERESVSVYLLETLTCGLTPLRSPGMLKQADNRTASVGSISP